MAFITKKKKYKLKAISWLEELQAEKNTITKGFNQLKIDSKTAYDSQALIELKTQYCDERHCLQCAVGNAILNSH